MATAAATPATAAAAVQFDVIVAAVVVLFVGPDSLVSTQSVVVNGLLLLLLLLLVRLGCAAARPFAARLLGANRAHSTPELLDWPPKEANSALAGTAASSLSFEEDTGH